MEITAPTPLQLTPADIALEVDVPHRQRLIEFIAGWVERRYGLTRVQASLEAREQLGSTGLGHGVAVPHARIKGLQQPRTCLVRTRYPIPFDAPDGKPVDLFFVLLVPEQATDQHLQLLAHIASRFSDRSFRERMHAAATADELAALFSPAD